MSCQQLKPHLIGSPCKHASFLQAKASVVAQGTLQIVPIFLLHRTTTKSFNKPSRSPIIGSVHYTATTTTSMLLILVALIISMLGSASILHPFLLLVGAQQHTLNPTQKPKQLGTAVTCTIAWHARHEPSSLNYSSPGSCGGNVDSRDLLRPNLKANYVPMTPKKKL